MLGCIVGPLFASYFLLPAFGERYGLVLLAIPFVVFYFLISKSLPAPFRFGIGLTAAALLCWSLFLATDFTGFVSGKTRVEVRRDYAASVVAAGEGPHKYLFVNGVGMTGLIPTTKFMVHMPLMLHTGKSESALIICFGMGTTFRSALSWDVETTAVELVPSVPSLFGFFHADAGAVVRSPRARIVVDDGRRFLERSTDLYDLITVDPPPPPTAAGSSLLHSREFYAVAKRRLRADGILQQWVPGGDPDTVASMTRALMESFRYVRVFNSVEGWGAHFLARMTPIDLPSPAVLAFRMPERARADMMEWGPATTPEEQADSRDGHVELHLEPERPEMIPAFQDGIRPNPDVLPNHATRTNVRAGSDLGSAGYDR